MDLDLLRTFVEVYRLRNFGAAARSLHVTQAAVSARVKLLESQLGTQLFDRSKREVRVTPEGHRFLYTADIIVSEWRRARHAIGRMGQETPQLSIAGSLRLWDIFLQTGWLHELRKARPDLAVTAETDNPESLMSRLFEGLIDVVVMLEPPRVELMTALPITRIDLVLVSSQADLNAEQAVIRDDYVWVDWGQSFDVEHRQCFPRAMAPMTTVSNSGMALDYIKALGGSAFLPARVAAPEIEAGTLFAVSDSPVMTRGVYGVFLQRNPKNRLIRSALRILDPGARVDLEELGLDES